MKQIIRSEHGDQWFIVKPMTKDEFIILRVFYNRANAEDWLEGEGA
jgi:hypothetical protein